MRPLLPLLLLTACLPPRPGAPPGPPPVDEARFADDLRAALPAWYAVHGADVSAAGGATVAEAVAAVDEALVERVTGEDGDPFALDLATTALYRHPDVVFPGSDVVWFGAYDLVDGSRLLLEPFE